MNRLTGRTDVLTGRCPDDCVQVHSGRATRFSLSIRRSRAPGALAVGCHQSAELLRAGASLVDALDAVAASEPSPRRRAFWSALARNVESGAALSRALVAGELVFPVELVARVRAAELDGEMALAFDDLEQSLLRSARHRARLGNALAYPVFATLVLAGSLGFLLTRIVPSLAANSGDVLAWHSVPLVWLSGQLLDPSGVVRLIVVSLGVAALGIGVLRRRRNGRSGVTRSLDLSRVADTVARLHVAGVSLDEAMGIASSACHSAVLVRDLERARRRIVAGASLSTSLAGSEGLPPLFVRFVAAGESSGALDAALTRAASHLEAEAIRVLDRREAMAGPVVLSLAGGVLCWVVISILLPVYERALEAGLS